MPSVWIRVTWLFTHNHKSSLVHHYHAHVHIRNHSRRCVKDSRERRCQWTLPCSRERRCQWTLPCSRERRCQWTLPCMGAGVLPGVVLGHQVQVIQSAVVEVGVGHQRRHRQVVGCVCSRVGWGQSHSLPQSTTLPSQYM